MCDSYRLKQPETHKAAQAEGPEDGAKESTVTSIKHMQTWPYAFDMHEHLLYSPAMLRRISNTTGIIPYL